MFSKQRFVIFCATLCNAFAALYTIFPLVKDLGYQNANPSDLVPFLASRTHPANSLFLYVVCFSTVLLAGGIYFLGMTYLGRLRSLSSVFREITLLDGIFSLVALERIRICASVSEMYWVHVVHLVGLGVTVGLLSCKSIAARLSGFSMAYKAGSTVFCLLVLVLFGYVAVYGPLNYVRGAVLSGTLLYFWPLCGAVLCALVAGYLFNLMPLPEKIRSRLALLISLACDLYIVRSLVLFTFRNESAYFDASTIVAPMHDILLGKDIGVNIDSTYGFLNIYLFALFCKLFGVVDYYRGLSYFSSGCFALGYSAMYLLLRYHTKNIVLSLLATIFVVSTNFNYTHVPVHWMPQSGLFRFGAFIPMTITLYFLDSFRGKRVLEWLAAGVIAFSMLQLPETGLYALVAILSIVAVQIIFVRDWYYAHFVAKLCAVLMFVAAAMELYVFIKYRQHMDWVSLMYFQVMYSKYGLAIYNFQSVGLWAIVSLVYIVGIFMMFARAVNRESGRHDTAWMFLSTMGPLMLLYFVGKQGLTDLVRVQMPAVMLAAVGADYILRKSSYRPIVAAAVYGLAAFAVASSWSANDRFGMKDHWLLTTPRHYSTETPWLERFFGNREHYLKFLQDVEVIKTLVAPDEGLALMSHMDTAFYLAADRKSVFRNKFYPHFGLESEMEKNANLIHTSGTRYFFVEHTNFQQYSNLVSDHITNTLKYPINRFNLVKKLNFLDIYEVVR